MRIIKIKLLGIFLCCILIFTIIFLICGCRENTSKQIKLGLTPAVDAIPFIIAQENGIFKKNNVDVKLEVFKSAKDRDTAFQSSDIDGVLSDIVAVCLYNNAGFEVKITGITDGDFMLVANKESGIKNIQDIKSCDIAISEKTVIEYSLDKIIDKNSINTSNIKKVIVPPIPLRLEMLRANKVQLALLPEPFSSLAIKDGAVLLDSAYQNKIFSNVSVFKKTSIDNNKAAIKALYKSYDEAIDYINDTPITDYEDSIIKFIGYPTDMKGQIRLPQYRKNDLPQDEWIQAAIDWARAKGLVTRELTPDELREEGE